MFYLFTDSNSVQNDYLNFHKETFIIENEENFHLIFHDFYQPFSTTATSRA